MMPKTHTSSAVVHRCSPHKSVSETLIWRNKKAVLAILVLTFEAIDKFRNTVHVNIILYDQNDLSDHICNLLHCDVIC